MLPEREYRINSIAAGRAGDEFAIDISAKT
jgi:hypothetical protein